MSLIEHMIKHCDLFYRNTAIFPHDNCNHPVKCNSICVDEFECNQNLQDKRCKYDCEREHCKKCLNEIHFPVGTNTGKKTYDCQNMLAYYVCRYSYKYCSEVLYALNEVNLDKYPCYNILSIGCGSAPDLMAFECVNSTKKISYVGIDNNEHWKQFHKEIQNYYNNNISSIVQMPNFLYKDAFTFFDNNPYKDFNIIVIGYLISYSYNTGQCGNIDKLFDRVISNIVKNRLDNSPMLIIISDVDSNERGCDLFYSLQNKLQNANYNINVNAKRFNSNPHFKDSTQYNSDENKFTITGDFQKLYAVAKKCTAVQLIIEIN